MGLRRRLRLIVLHNRDFESADHPEFASRADVENAARDVAGALARAGHDVRVRAVPSGKPAAAVEATLRMQRAGPPDLVFNLCESLAGDARFEAALPTLFELYGIRYTGAGPLALATALRKDRAKAVLAAHGVSTPKAVVIDDAPVNVDLMFPLIVKPIREDGSTGIWLRSVVHSRQELEERVAEVRARYSQAALVEQFIVGRELYVSLIGNGEQLTALPMHEIDFSEMPTGAPHIVTYDGKWHADSIEYRGTRSVKAERLDAAVRARCEAVARSAFTALELRDYARIDVRLDANGTPYVIDVNPNCDLSDGAGVARAASFGGISYTELIECVRLAAWTRYHGESEQHDLEDVDAKLTGPACVERAAHSSHSAARPRPVASIVEQGRLVHARGSLGRARARRRRTR
jgi:D-alanine-D-alanine ligase